ASFAGGVLLKMIAFDASLPMQSTETMDKLLTMRVLLPIIAYVCTLIAMRFYPIDKAGEQQLQAALNNME
ncbi:MAG TPA: hypothetical protein DCG51_05400, partial [Erysipelotrichaceae bacterium]|nr:hypothetical protein [Erysipelotrichaceae bacterium]